VYTIDLPRSYITNPVFPLPNLFVPKPGYAVVLERPLEMYPMMDDPDAKQARAGPKNCSGVSDIMPAVSPDALNCT
jgi:hypothetical protein